MRLRQKVGCAIHGHLWEYRELDDWIVSTCQRCGTVFDLPASAYTEGKRTTGGDPGRGIPGAWIGFIQDFGSGDCGGGGGGDC